MNKVFGYSRTSTAKQNSLRQVRNIRAMFPDADIREEIFTGTKLQGRKELDKILREVRSGDTIVFDSVSRMSRNADEGVALYFRLFNEGVNLVFIKERTIDTDSYRRAVEGINLKLDVATGDSDADEFLSDMMSAVSKYISRLAEKQIRLAFDQAEKEVMDLRQRTKEGLETARRQGKEVGKHKSKTMTIKKVEPIKHIIKNKSKTFGIGQNTDAEVISIINGSTMTDDKGREVRLHVCRKSYYLYKRQMLEEMQA